MTIRHLVMQAMAFGLLVAAGAWSFACSPSKPVSYQAQILADRQAKDEALRTEAESPILPAERATRLPLTYFPPDERYRVPASLDPSTGSARVLEMPTSTGKLRKMQKVGTLRFSLDGQPMSLSAFVEAGSPTLDRLFVPFTDLTTGTETYPAGRYLDLDVTPTGIYIVDFNRAYNPFCAYNSSYDCPYPPKENRLPAPIRAGEREPRAN